MKEEIKHPSLENVREKKTNITEIGEHNVPDVVPHRLPAAGGDKGGRPVPTRATAAGQTRKGKESEEACSAGASNRERMVDIGRGNQQAGGKANETFRARLVRGCSRRGGNP
jgi:hypothetical protein